MPKTKLTLPNSRVGELLDFYGLNQARLAEMSNVSEKTASRWVSGHDPVPYTVAERFGVSYDWLAGRPKASMWSEEFVGQRKAVRATLIDVGAAPTISGRFADVTSWLLHHVVFVDGVLLSFLCRVEHATLASVLEGDATVGMPAVERIASFADVPVDWFVSGNNATLTTDDEYQAVVSEAKALGVDPRNLRRYIERIGGAALV